MKKIKSTILHFFHTVVFPKQLAFGVFFLNLFGDRKYCDSLKNKIDNCSENTVGFHLKKFMEHNKFEFVPWYENHDMKHVILEYKATASDENCMQAFMIGNSGFRPITTFLAILFCIWTPDVWKDLPYHFLIGRLTKPVNKLNIEETIYEDLNEIRKRIGIHDAKVQAALIYDLIFLGKRSSQPIKIF